LATKRTVARQRIKLAALWLEMIYSRTPKKFLSLSMCALAQCRAAHLEIKLKSSRRLHGVN
jgi:hypothetical protein